jgi:hypothetical protein
MSSKKALDTTNDLIEGDLDSGGCLLGNEAGSPGVPGLPPKG